MQRVSQLDLSTVSVKSVAGLSTEDVRELEGLNIGSVASLLKAYDDHDGDLTLVSTTAIVVDTAQSDRIAIALLACPKVPEKWKQQWSVYKPAMAAPAANGTPTGTVQVKENGVVQLMKGILSGITLGAYKG